MRKYIIRRLLLMPITLIGITFVVFCLTRMVPGGPVDRLLQEQAIGALAGEKSSGPGGATVGEADIISARGFGKAVVRECSRVSKKGRIILIMDRYI